MDPFIIWAFILFTVALVLFFIELLVPSGGIIGVLAGAALITGLICMFQFNTTSGLFALIASLIALPFLVGLAIKFWPNTPIARLLALETRQPRHMSPKESDQSEMADVEKLMGATGQAITDLRPVGTCMINGRRTECLADGGMIQTGSPVRVVAASGMQIKVRLNEIDI